MRLASTKTAAVLCGGLLLALSVPVSAAVDAKLLDMLKANGQITAAQYSATSSSNHACRWRA